MKIKLVTLKYPCGACALITQLAVSVCERLAREHEGVTLERVVLEHPRAARGVEGLEVEAFPALIIDGEQVTAGSIPDRRALEARVARGNAGGYAPPDPAQGAQCAP